MYFIGVKTENQKRTAERIIKNSGREDFLVPGDSYAFVESLDDLCREMTTGKSLILKSSVHIWNEASVESLLALGLSSFYFIGSYELTEHELRELYEKLPENVTMLLPIYGRVPLMFTKNCVKKTEGLCNKTSEFVRLKDRKNVYFPVYSDCEKCRNIIYNSVPLFLNVTVATSPCHIFKDFYIEFTDEDEAAVEAVLNYYLGNLSEPPIKSYTTGHYKKSVK